MHTDLLGSPIAETDAYRRVIKRFNYKPYGESHESLRNNEAGFSGHMQDSDIGLTYMHARYYDASIGRFYSNDPIDMRLDDPISFNRYVYANNNPYKYVDPDGKLPILVPVVVFVAKEAIGAIVESQTGIPVTTKGLAKAAVKQVLWSNNSGDINRRFLT